MTTPNGQEGELREKLAALEHVRWARWQKYVHDLYRQSDGSVLIPAGHAYAWDKQIHTPYQDLSEKEKEKDSEREQVDEYLPLLKKETAAAYERGKRDGRAEGAREAYDAVFALAPKQNFEHWSKKDIADWFIALGKLERDRTQLQPEGEGQNGK